MALLTKKLKDIEASDSEEGEEGEIEFMEAKRESFVFFDIGKEMLNGKARAIGEHKLRKNPFTKRVTAPWNNRLPAGISDKLYNLVSVVSLIGDNKMDIFPITRSPKCRKDLQVHSLSFGETNPMKIIF
jgi:hypothetical protein